MSTQTPVLPFADLAADKQVVDTAADGAVRLIAARCSACSTAWFPRSAVCPSCAASDPERYLIGPSGTLYSYSTVHVSSARETPYTIGYVDLDEGVRVLATLDMEAGSPALDTRGRLQASDDGRWWFTVEEN